MHTLRLFASRQLQVPATTAWYLSDLGEFRGKQELYTRQSPQRLKVLREHALIESAVSSNRIEGVAVEASRIREVLVAPKPLFRDRDEEEVRGYRDALTWIHGQANEIAVTEATIKHLHATARGQIWDAGLYKDKDGDIIERYPDGRERVRFTTVPAADTPRYMSALVADWESCIDAALGASGDIAGRVQSGFSLCPSFPRWQRASLQAAVAVAKLSPGLRGGPLYQSGAAGGAEQGPLLRDIGTKLAGLARGQARSLAFHQLRAVDSQIRLP